MTQRPSGDANTPNLEDLLRLGINTAKAGNRESARMIFQQVLEQDKRNERAWLWLASVADDPLEKRRILQTVLAINPTNANAKRLLDALDDKRNREEQRSMRVGIIILVGIVLLLIVVVAIVIIV